eukprot:1359695-Pleurochrysis_carterae.AAC.1
MPAPAPGSNAIKRFTIIVTPKRGGRGSASWLLEAFRFSINQRHLDLELSELTAVAAEIKLLVQWNAIAFNSAIFEPISAVAVSTAAAAAEPASAAAGSLSEEAPAHAAGVYARLDTEGKDIEQSSRAQLPGAGSCPGASHIPLL